MTGFHPAIRALLDLPRRFTSASAAGHAAAHPEAKPFTLLPGPAWPGEIAEIADRPAIAIARPFARLAPGSVIGITGAAGSGKTVLLERLAGLRATAEAQIAVDGADITTIDPATLGRCFAYAPRDGAPLAGTLRESLMQGHLPQGHGPEMTEASLWSALHDVALDQRLRALPLGLDSRQGKDCADLSESETRRLCLARAYLQAAPWLLLDEPTAGLEPAAEAKLTARLRRRLARTGQGALIVSRRDAVLAICTARLHLGRPVAAGPAPVALQAARENRIFARA
jgi:ATP-binding cassette, subfamily C, bacterial CydC